MRLRPQRASAAFPQRRRLFPKGSDALLSIMRAQGCDDGRQPQSLRVGRGMAACVPPTFDGTASGQLSGVHRSWCRRSREGSLCEGFRTPAAVRGQTFVTAGVRKPSHFFRTPAPLQTHAEKQRPASVRSTRGTAPSCSQEITTPHSGLRVRAHCGWSWPRRDAGKFGFRLVR